jgi:transcriptional regulator with XRE-family HTH domain
MAKRIPAARAPNLSKTHPSRPLQRKPGEQPQSFGKLLRVLRHGQGYTQRGLAQRAHMHPRMIDRLERGFAVPTVHTILYLAPALSVQDATFMALIDAYVLPKLVLREGPSEGSK